MNELMKADDIQNKIFTIRGVQVMIDRDLAELYGVETRVLNQAVKRNIKRFPDDFMFQLKKDEFENLMSQNVISSFTGHGGVRKMPFVFTEQGVSMLSAVLKSDIAVEVSIKIIKAFVNMRKFLVDHGAIFQRLNMVELKQLKTDEKIEQILKALGRGVPSPEKGVFFEGQIFDAHVVVSNIIRKAEKEIVLIDNYVDESVLLLLTKRRAGVRATIYTKTITPPLKLDLQKHNRQYPGIEIKTITNAHDRFLIIDGKDLYHIGASLKDLGKKWFAFSRLNDLLPEILKRLDR